MSKRKQIWTDLEFYSLLRRKKKELGGKLSDTDITRLIARDYITYEKWTKGKKRRSGWL